MTISDPDRKTVVPEGTSATFEKITEGSWTFLVTSRGGAASYTLTITAT